MIKKDFDETIGGYFTNNNLDRDDVKGTTKFGLYKIYYKGELIHTSRLKMTKTDMFKWKNDIIISKIEEINKKKKNN